MRVWVMILEMQFIVMFFIKMLSKKIWLLVDDISASSLPFAGV